MRHIVLFETIIQPRLCECLHKRHKGLVVVKRLSKKIESGRKYTSFVCVKIKTNFYPITLSFNIAKNFEINKLGLY